MSKHKPLLLHLYEYEPAFVPSDILTENFELLSKPFNFSTIDIEQAIGIILEINDFKKTHAEHLKFFYTSEHKSVAILVCEKYDPFALQLLSLRMQSVWFPSLSTTEDSKILCDSILPMLRIHTDALDYFETLKLRSHRSGLVDSLNIVAHQWRQPINLISMEAINLSIQSSLESSIPSASILKSTELISEQTQRMADILKSVLNMGKTNRGKEPFSVNEMIERVVLFFVDQLKHDNIQLDLILLKHDKLIYGYPTDIEEVLVNLIVNAKDAFHTRNTYPKQIILEALYTDNAVQINVKDNAGGIAQEIKEKIFEPHFSTKGSGEGFGIGLHVARLLIEQEFKGSLTLTVKGQETHFIIIIPYHDPSELKFINS